MRRSSMGLYFYLKARRFAVPEIRGSYVTKVIDDLCVASHLGTVPVVSRFWGYVHGMPEPRIVKPEAICLLLVARFVPSETCFR